MDVLPRITRQLVELFQAMSPVQRATFVAVPLLILAGLTSIVVLNRPDDHQAVLFGRTFTTEELATAEKALNQAGLLNYRREDRKLVVPGPELDRYNAALVEFDAVPPDLGSQILKQFESLGPFSTDRHRQEMKDALLLQELRRMIKSVPDIEDARVAVASSGRRVGFGQKPRVTANVTVKPRAGRELSARLVGSLRQAVASMVPDLQATDVTVFDVARGQTFTGNPNEESLDGRLIQRVRDFTRQYEQQIQKALAFIPHATVAVHVDLDNLKSSVIRRERVRVTNDDTTIANRPGSVQQVAHDDDQDSIHHSAAFRGQTAPTDYTREVSERELLAAMPRAVQVSVSIPRDYYRHVATRRQGQGESNKRRLDLDSIEEEILTKVERTVSRLIPVGSPHDAISVTTIDHMPLETTETTLSTTDQLTVLAWKHGGSWGLGLFAVIALWMLSRLALAPSPVAARAEAPAQPRPIMTPSPVVPEMAPFVAPVEITPSVPVPPEPVFRASPVTTSATATMLMRDEILALAQSDPATTAAVLSQWLAEAR
jgi:flagellar biosynthesis/type III secretory pathway M-ring protein FliF/YscJ